MTEKSTGKDKIEDICRKAGLKPATRRRVRDLDLLIADGFTMPPHKDYWERFGLDKWDYPGGCYVTAWFLMKGEDRMFVGFPMFFEAGHNPEWDVFTKKQARLNQAAKSAQQFVEQVRANGRILH